MASKGKCVRSSPRGYWQRVEVWWDSKHDGMFVAWRDVKIFFQGGDAWEALKNLGIHPNDVITFPTGFKVPLPVIEEYAVARWGENPHMNEVTKMARGMSDAAYELKLFTDNDADLYRQQFIPIVKNLMTKIGRGTYDHEKAVKLFMYLCENGAKKYVKEFGGGVWHQVFTVADRKQAATALRDDFEVEAEAGSYDNYLPKKYAGKAKGARGKKNPSKAPHKQNLLDRVYASHFLMAYFEALLWAETADDGEEDDDRSWQDKGYDLSDFAADTLASLISDADRFLAAPGVEQALEGVTRKWEERAGHDLWLTRQGHGAGFWDGDWPEPDATVLTKAAEKIGECWLYSRNGKIYVGR